MKVVLIMALILCAGIVQATEYGYNSLESTDFPYGGSTIYTTNNYDGLWYNNSNSLLINSSFPQNIEIANISTTGMTKTGSDDVPAIELGTFTGSRVIPIFWYSSISTGLRFNEASGIELVLLGNVVLVFTGSGGIITNSSIRADYMWLEHGAELSGNLQARFINSTGYAVYAESIGNNNDADGDTDLGTSSPIELTQPICYGSSSASCTLYSSGAIIYGFSSVCGAESCITSRWDLSSGDAKFNELEVVENVSAYESVNVNDNLCLNVSGSWDCITDWDEINQTTSSDCYVITRYEFFDIEGALPNGNPVQEGDNQLDLNVAIPVDMNGTIISIVSMTAVAGDCGTLPYCYMTITYANNTERLEHATNLTWGNSTYVHRNGRSDADENQQGWTSLDVVRGTALDMRCSWGACTSNQDETLIEVMVLSECSEIP